MNDELKSLIEDAAKLLGYWDDPEYNHEFGILHGFNPLDPERGDLMKVAMGAGLDVDFELAAVYYRTNSPDLLGGYVEFTKGNYQSLALAILRAASAVLKARNGNAE